jgi:hypothetical protein
MLLTMGEAAAAQSGYAGASLDPRAGSNYVGMKERAQLRNRSEARVENLQAYAILWPAVLMEMRSRLQASVVPATTSSQVTGMSTTGVSMRRRCSSGSEHMISISMILRPHVGDRAPRFTRDL